MFKSFTLRAKLILGFVFVASMVAGATYYQSALVKNTHELFDDLISNDIERLQAIEEIRFLVSDIQHSILASPTPLTAAQLESEKTELSQQEARLSQEQSRYATHLQSDAQESIDETELAKLKTEIDAFVSQGQDVLQQSRNGNLATLQIKEEAFEQRAQAINLTTDSILAAERQTIAEEDKAADREFVQSNTRAILVASLPILAALGMGFLISGVIARALNKIREGAQRIANGDFSQSIPTTSTDEVGQLSRTFNQMSDRLRESYRRLAYEKQQDEAVMESMSEGLIVVDEQNKVVMINSVATQMLRFPSRDEVIGTSLYGRRTLFTTDDKPLPEDQHPAHMALEEGKPESGVFIYHYPNSPEEKILLYIGASPVMLDNKTVGAIIVLRDVTKEKEIDRMKTEFISLASHQLRTPLSAIKWFTEMLLSGDAGKLTDEQSEFAKNISDSSERMIELVNSLLNISRIESGRIIVDPKPTDLSELVGGIVNDLKAKTEEKKQTLIISVHKDLPKINLDPRLIGQVYMNLLTNAIKYTPQGGEISVFISIKDDQVLSQVTDNGYGIPKAQHDKVFQKFFRAENIVKVETDGTGLGLYLIKAIIESSGGKVWFESEEGKGTTFWFTLPLAGMIAKEGEVTLDA